MDQPGGRRRGDGRTRARAWRPVARDGVMRGGSRGASSIGVDRGPPALLAAGVQVQRRDTRVACAGGRRVLRGQHVWGRRALGGRTAVRGHAHWDARSALVRASTAVVVIWYSCRLSVAHGRRLLVRGLRPRRVSGSACLRPAGGGSKLRWKRGAVPLTITRLNSKRAPSWHLLSRLKRPATEQVLSLCM